MKFLHAADLHIDSPLRGLEAYDGAPVDRIRSATREAFENLISLAINEHVDFVILAGDLFDGQWRDIQTGLWTARQFRRLEDAGITVYLLRGNHDALSEVDQRVRWPDNVIQFSVEAPRTVVDESLGVALHGQGFATREISDDIASRYPDPIPGMFNIGVLHTSLTGDPNHDTYAATTEDVLLLRGYDFWALGHIHARRTVREEPLIVFPGNTQGRHINERGEKGCLLVTVKDRNIENADFRATDVLRWHLIEIELDRDDELDELYAKVRQQLHEKHLSGDGRFSACRVVVRGAAKCHSQLVSRIGREESITEIRNIANSIDDDIWIEKVIFETSAPIDVDQIRRGNDLMGDLLRSVANLRREDDGTLAQLAAEFEPLTKKASLELQLAGITIDDAESIRRWLQQAEGLLVSMLCEEEA